MATISPATQAIEDSLVLQGELLDDFVGVGARIGALEAERVEVLARRLDLLAQDRLSGDEMAFRSMCAEYAAAGRLSPSTFAAHITAAWMLARTLPVTFAALTSGAISKRHADVIVAAAPDVSGHGDAEHIRAAYEARVVPFAQRETAARTRTAAREIAAAVFPEGTAAQHRRARGERAVTVRADGDGMAVLTAILPEVLAYAIHDRLTQMGNTVIQARPEGQRRPRRSTIEKIRTERDTALAGQEPTDPEPPTDLEEHFLDRLEHEFDAAPPWENDLDSTTETSTTETNAADDADDADDDANITESDLLGTGDDGLFLESTPMHDGYGAIEHDTRTLDQLRADILTDMLLTTAPTSITETSLEAVKATVQITIPASSLTGHDSLAQFDGHGPTDINAARILAGHATSWDRILLDPHDMVTQTDNYVPTASMKRHLRARDQHCRFPGCRAPAHRCQIDHTHDHATGGPTALNNLSHLCTNHHPLKHPDIDDRDRWTAKQLDHGIILWTSPLGHTYTDQPPLRVMFT